MTQSGIYKITNIRDGKYYLGSAYHLSNRKSSHFSALRLNKHKNPRLQNSYNKHGEAVFEFEIIEYCNKEEVLIREQYYMNTLNPFYNICRIAGNTAGRLMSAEARIKMSEAKKAIGFAPSDEVRQLALVITKGRKLPKESLEKRLKTMSNWSEEQKLEHREKLSKGALNRSRESLDKIAKGRFKPINQLALEGNIIREWDCAQNAGLELNISKASIGACCKGKVGYKTAGGFRWEFSIK